LIPLLLDYKVSLDLGSGPDLRNGGQSARAIAKRTRALRRNIFGVLARLFVMLRVD
jgi:hypothetical protein